MSENIESPASQPKTGSSKPMVFLSLLLAVGCAGLGISTYQAQKDGLDSRKRFSLQEEAHKNEKEALIRQNADRVLAISKSYQEDRAKVTAKPAITPVDVTFTSPTTVTLHYLDASGAKQELKNISVAKSPTPVAGAPAAGTPIPGKPNSGTPAPGVPNGAPAKPVPTLPATGAPPLDPTLQKAWAQKEKAMNETIAKLTKEVRALREKITALPTEMKAGESGWAQIGELEGTNIVQTPFEKETILIDPDPNVKHKMRETRDLVARLDGGKTLGTLKPGRIVSISQTKIIQGKVFALLLISK